jgi:hypothetical protein
MAKEAEFNADATDGDGDGLVQDGTMWERPVGTQPEGYKADARDGDGDGKVQDGTVFERDAEPQAVVADAEEKKPARKTPAKSKKADPKTVPTELSSDITVSRAKLVHKSLFEHNSRSVGVTQIRLIELGYAQASADKRGYLGDPTLEAIKEFADDHGLEANDLTNEELVKAIFAGTPVTIGM